VDAKTGKPIQELKKTDLTNTTTPQPGDTIIVFDPETFEEQFIIVGEEKKKKNPQSHTFFFPFNRLEEKNCFKIKFVYFFCQKGFFFLFFFSPRH